MVTIHFSSGKIQELPGKNLEKMVTTFQMRGMKLYKEVNRETGDIIVIPLNSSTIEYITGSDEKLIRKPEPTPVVEENEISMEEQLAAMKEELAAAVKEVEDKKDVEEKRADIEKEFMAKANCKHPKELEEVYVQTTARGSKYFPVCSFCGKRGRFVKKDILTDEQKATAKPWTE